MPLPIHPAISRLDAKLAWLDSGGGAGAGFEQGAKEPRRSLRTQVAPFIVINDQAARPA